MKTKAGKMFLVFGLMVVIAAVAVAAVTNKSNNHMRTHESKGKALRAEKTTVPGEARITSSAKITTRGAEKNRYIMVRQLTTNPEDDRYPDFSPDGQWIVYQARDPNYGTVNNRYGIWKINVDGTGLTPLALPDTAIYYDQCFAFPMWSPLGNKILYQAYGDTTHTGGMYASSFIMDPDGSNRERVTADSAYCRSHATWSPDGNRIVCRNGALSSHVAIYDIGTGLETDLGMGTELSEFPKFSPDGSKILYKSSDYLHVIDTSGTNDITIEDASYFKHADWSPDGEKIVYNNDRDYSNYADLWIANADGSGKHPIIEDATQCFIEPDWQALGSGVNGRWIVHGHSVDGSSSNKDIWIVSTDGRYRACLWTFATTNNDPVSPTWSLQGDKIVFSSDCFGNWDLFVIELDADDDDFDGLANWEEYAGYGTDPDNRDTDGGDENDGSEILAGRDPLDPGDDLSAGPPYTDGHDPLPGATGVDPNTNIIVHVKDDGAGVDVGSIVLTIEGQSVLPNITGNLVDYKLTYDPLWPLNPGEIIEVTVNASDLAQPPHVMPTDAYFFTIAAIGVEEGNIGIPTEFNLSQNAPNPTNNVTTIRYQVPRSVKVTLRVYDASGRLVKTLVNASKEPGYYSMNWDLKDNSGRKVAKGVYYYKLEAEEYNSTKKIVVE